MTKSHKFVYRTMIAVCVLMCAAVVIHLLLFVSVRNSEAFNAEERSDMWLYWNRILTQLEAVGMTVTIVVPLVLITGWTIWVVKLLRKRIDVTQE